MSTCDLPNIFPWNSGRSCQRSWLLAGDRCTPAYTHAASMASKTRTTKSTRDVFLVHFSSAHHGTLLTHYKAPEILILLHRIIAQGRSAVPAGLAGARSWTTFIRPWQQRLQRAALASPELALPFIAGQFFPETELATFIRVSFIYRLGNGRMSFKMKEIKTQEKRKILQEQKL